MRKNTTPINPAIAKMLSDKDIQSLNKPKLSEKIWNSLEKISDYIKYSVNWLLSKK